MRSSSGITSVITFPASIVNLFKSSVIKSVTGVTIAYGIDNIKAITKNNVTNILHHGNITILKQLQHFQPNIWLNIVNNI